MTFGEALSTLFSSGKSEVTKGVRRGAKKARKITVDVADRMQKSFGSPIGQLAEFHYEGQPLTFRYGGPVELLTIDVLHREQQEHDLKQESSNHKKGKKEEISVEQFDSTKRRIDAADVHLSCSCGMTFKTKVPVGVVRTGNDNIKRAIDDQDIKKHMRDLHTLNVSYVEVHDEIIPEKYRIKDFDQTKVNFYRLFPKKTTEVKYLVSYDQDLLAEAPQVKLSETSAGSRKLRKQTQLLMFFLIGVMEAFTYIFASASAQAYPIGQRSNYTAWYVTIFTIVGAIVVVWMIKIREMGKTKVKLINLQPAPFYISNRGILPVVMTNSVLNKVWDYQARAMGVSDKDARDVYYSLTTWSDSQIAELYRAKQLGMVEHELTVINNEIRDIQKLDMDYRNQTTNQSATTMQITIAVVITVLVYSVAMIGLGFF